MSGFSDFSVGVGASVIRAKSRKYRGIFEEHSPEK